jgi:flavin-dependent dehydrogenase
MIFDVGPFALVGGIPVANQGRGGFCPRRTILDKLLVDAAVEAGVELREGFCTTELVWDNDRVVGVRGHGRSGGAVEERATIVIGADGEHSLVAKAVGAKEYDTKPPIATYYYSYYSGFAADELEQHVRDYFGIGCFPTHYGQTLIVGVWPSRMFADVRSDLEGHMGKNFSQVPKVGDRIQRATRDDRWYGTAGVANFFRQPFGPGWALVGDAGYNKDPLTAQGISDAFLDADGLAAALDAGWSGRNRLEDALAGHHAARDQRAKPMYDFTCELAKLEPAPPHMQQLFAALHGNQDATNQFFAALTGAVPVPSFMNPENIGRIVAGAGV